ncbi:uncharacterized protein LOC121626477 isoform X2 [Chelmon rostratus]|uniref:uncharacterized protein LOC121626477 isoform X2 n=1 Tax=Chelmon rostratus TaxID=109905 RepID=UPI001BE75596|nr:uncharacterized protein LOC121626477 isoform X2 [Chelmon rostratus]
MTDDHARPFRRRSSRPSDSPLMGLRLISCMLNHSCRWSIHANTDLLSDEFLEHLDERCISSLDDKHHMKEPSCSQILQHQYLTAALVRDVSVMLQSYSGDPPSGASHPHLQADSESHQAVGQTLWPGKALQGLSGGGDRICRMRQEGNSQLADSQQRAEKRFQANTEAHSEAPTLCGCRSF